MIDQTLNSELRNGSPSAYERLYSLTSKRLENYCKLFLKDHVLIEDLVQNAYLKLWEKRSLIRLENSVESLLFTMVRNQCLNYLRDQKLADDIFSIDENPWGDLQHLYQLDFAGPEASGEDKTLEEQLLEALKNAIDDLPERQSEILVKCKIEGKKQKTVADELGISLKAVEKSLSKSKRQLQSILLSRFPELSLMISFLF
jgi:RNA polymerase sigma-70 factor (ECF subfamily)